MKLSEGEFPADMPREYRKSFEDLYEFLNAIALTLSKVKDTEWRRKLAETCILALGFHELPEVRERLKRESNSKRETCII